MENDPIGRPPCGKRGPPDGHAPPEAWRLLHLFRDSLLATNGLQPRHAVRDRRFRERRATLEFLQDTRTLILLLEATNRAVYRLTFLNGYSDQCVSPPLGSIFIVKSFVNCRLLLYPLSKSSSLPTSHGERGWKEDVLSSLPGYVIFSMRRFSPTLLNDTTIAWLPLDVSSLDTTVPTSSHALW